MWPLRRGTFVVLGKEAIEYCKEISAKRYHANDLLGVRDARWSSQSREDIGLQGCLGEWAFAQMAGVNHSLSDTTPRSARTDLQQDLVVNSKTFDVKTAKTYLDRVPQGLHVSTKKKINPADYYVLLHYLCTHQDSAKVVFLGYAVPEDIFHDDNIREQPQRESSVATYQYHMVPYRSLRQLLQKPI
jgi:hypothetical protein